MPLTGRIERVRLGETRSQPVVGSASPLPGLSSGNLWRGIRLEQAKANSGGEVPEGCLVSHVVGVALAPLVCEVSLSGKWTTVRFEAGDFYVTPSAMPYAVRWRGPAHFILLETSLESVHAVAGNDVAARALEVRPAHGRDQLLTQLALGLRDELQAGNPRGRLYGETLGAAFTAHLLHTHGAFPVELRRLRGGLAPGRLRLVLEYIDAHLETAPSLEDLANVAGFSSFHFARLFKQSTGIAPHQYFSKRRVELATTLLREGRLSIAEIALRCGFANQSHFADVFRRALGVAPREYRRTTATQPLSSS
jgi:AraC family transcriptional regulator